MSANNILDTDVPNIGVDILKPTKYSQSLKWLRQISHRGITGWLVTFQRPFGNREYHVLEDER